MADIQEIREAFMRAHRAGDTKNAAILAKLLEKQLAAQQQDQGDFPEMSFMNKTAAPEQGSGFISGMKSGLANLKGDFYAGQAAAGVEGAEEKAKAQRERAGQIHKQADFTEHPIDYLTGMLGQSIPYMAAPAAAALVANPIGGALAATGAAGLTSLTQFSLSNLSRQLEEGTAAKDLNVAGAIGAAAPQAALDIVGFRFIPGLGKIFGAAGKELTEQQLQQVFRHYVTQTAKTATAEGLTEAGQQVLERAQAGLNLTDPQARQEYFDNFIGGALLGGTLSVPGTMHERSQGFAKQEAQKQALADEEAQRAAQAEAERRNAPDYLKNLAAQFDTLKQQETTLREELKPFQGKKGRKALDGLDEDARAAVEEKMAALKEARSQLSAMSAEYREALPKIKAIKEQERIAALDPNAYFDEINGYPQPAEKSAADPMQEWLDQQSYKEPEREPSELQRDLDELLGGLRHFDTLTPTDAAEVLIRDPLLANKVMKGEMTIPEFNRKQFGELQDALKLQFNDLAVKMGTGREGFEAQRKAEEEQRKYEEGKPERLQLFADEQDAKYLQSLEDRIGDQLEALRQKMEPGISGRMELPAEERDVQGQLSLLEMGEKKPLRSSDIPLTEEEKLQKDSIARANKAQRTSEEALNNLFVQQDPAKVPEAQQRYIDAVMDEVENRRAANGQGAVEAQKAESARAQLATLIGYLRNQQVDVAQFRQQLDLVKNRLMEGAGNQTRMPKRDLKALANDGKIRAEERPAQPQNYRAAADELVQEQNAHLLDFNAAMSDLHEGLVLNAPKFKSEQAKMASSTRETLTNSARKSKEAYISAALQEAAYRRQLEGMQPLTKDAVKGAISEMNAAFDKALKNEANAKQLQRALEMARDRLRMQHVASQKVGLKSDGVLSEQGNNREAKRVEEERGDNAKTAEGQLRRKRDYVGKQIEKALQINRRSALGMTLPLDARRLLERTQDAIEDGIATNDVLDQAGDIADRALRGQLTRTEVGKLRDALNSMDQAATERRPESYQRDIDRIDQELKDTDPENEPRVANLKRQRERLMNFQREAGKSSTQGDLFAADEVGGRDELGTIRATAANFQRFLQSKELAKLKKLLGIVEKVTRDTSKEPVPGNKDEAFFRGRIDTLEKQIAQAKENLEDLGDASWESIMNLQGRMPEEVRVARQKLYALMQEKLQAELAHSEALRKKHAGKNGKEFGIRMQEADALRTQIKTRSGKLLHAMGQLVKYVRETRKAEQYLPVINQFEEQAAEAEKKLAELNLEARLADIRSDIAPGTMDDYNSGDPAVQSMNLLRAEAALLQSQIDTAREQVETLYAKMTGTVRDPIVFSQDAFDAAKETLAARKAELKAAQNQPNMSKKSLGRIEVEVAKAEMEVAEQKRIREKYNAQQKMLEDTREDTNDGLIAVADERIVAEKAEIKRLEDALKNIDLIGSERTKTAVEAAAKRREVALAERQLQVAKDMAKQQAEKLKAELKAKTFTSIKRVVKPVERIDSETGEKVIVEEAGTGEPLRQKITSGAYAQRKEVKGVNWESKRKATPISKDKTLSIEQEAATEEPVAKAQKKDAFENLQDFAKVAGTLARQANVTDVNPHKKHTAPLRTGGAQVAAESFAKNDASVKVALEQFGRNSNEYKKALRDAVQKYGAKLAKEVGYAEDMLPLDKPVKAQVGKKGAQLPAGMSEKAYEKAIAEALKSSANKTAYRIGEGVANPVNEAEAQAFIDKVKAKLPKGVRFVYAKTLLHAPGKMLKAMAADGMDVESSKVRGAVLEDGTVVIIGNHHSSMVDLEKTVVHELAHYGTDTLLGQQGMDALYAALEKNPGGIMQIARELGVADDVLEATMSFAQQYEAAQKRGASKEELNDILRKGQRQALREMLAHVAEAEVDKTFLQKAGTFIKAMIGALRAALRRMGFTNLAAASTSDIYYEIRRAHRALYNNSLGAYVNPNGETVFRRGTAQYGADVNPAFTTFAAKSGVGKLDGPNKVFSNTTGIGLKTALVDRFAPLQAVADYMKRSAKAMQMMYYARMHDQRMSFTAATVNGGARTVATDEKGNFIVKEAGTASLKDVIDTLGRVKGHGFQNAAAVRDAFDSYLKAHRAKRVGGHALNMLNPPTPAEIEATIKAGDAIPEFVAARKQYNEYNKGLINWLVASDAISKEVGAQLTSTNDYVPFYRVKGDDILFEIGDRTPLVIGDLKNQPYLQELVGGIEETKDFFTAALQNTAMLTDMGLRNLATKSVAFSLQEAGLLKGRHNEKTGKTKGIFDGNGPASPNVIRFKVHGQPKFAIVDTDTIGVPADMLVQGLHGTVTQLGGFVKMMAIPARFMRVMITRNPMYSLRQIVRDSTSNYLLTGGNMKPVASALQQVLTMWQGTNKREIELQERGILGGQIINGTSEDMQKIMLQLVNGRAGWESALAKLDTIAMKADASSRVALYNDYRKQGLSDMEATLATLESMNFSKRGTSGTLYKLNMMVPFLNAQIQGLNVLWEAFTGKLPYAQAVKAKQKFYTRAAMLAASTMMYSLMMEDDEEYKNASLRDRLQNWLIKIPGVDDPIKIPIPFEAGLIFKALPEAMMLMTHKDEEATEVVKALAGMVAMSTPVGVSTQPQAIKPLIEAALNKSFFTGRDIESQTELGLLPAERSRAGTSELAKLISGATASAAQSMGFDNGGVSPIMVEHFVNGYAGGMGLAIMQAANAVLPTQTGTEAPTKRLSEMPVVGQLFQPHDAQGQVSAMYERAKRYEQIKNSYDKMVAEGRGSDAMALAQQYAKEIAMTDIADDFKKELGKFSKIEKQINASALSGDEKRARLDEIRQAKISLARAFNEAALRE